MSNEKQEWTEIGSICKSKANKLYIKVEKGVTLKEDSMLVLRKVSDEIKGQFERGFIDEETRDERLEKLSWKKYKILLPPDKDE